MLLPFSVGLSHNQTLQQWPVISTKRGDRHNVVSLGGVKFSFGHNDEQACLPFCKLNIYIKQIIKILHFH